jgi:predicted phage baseplate assembly protein
VGDFPPSLEDEDANERLLTWIRIGLPETTTGDPTNSALSGQFSWVGINAARITQQVNVPFEPLGTGTGTPDQSFTLANTPVIENSVSVTVGGDPWTAIDDLLAAPAEVPAGDTFSTTPAAPGDPNVFTVDRASGIITFGDGLRGARPPAGAAIVAGYAYGGGVAGNVGVAAVKTAPSLPAGFSVTNPIRTAGGSNGETVDDATRNIPRYIQNRDRAVSASDFQDIVRRTPAIDLGRVEILPLFQPGSAVNIPGAVTVLVIPNDPKQTGAPKPDMLFIEAVCQYLEPRRVLTTEVYVTGPDYVGLSVALGIDVTPGRDIPTVREAVKDAVRAFLAPVNPDGTGWPLAKTVEDREVWAQATRVDGLSNVRAITMWDETGAAITSLPVTGLQLPRLDRVSVSLGDPEDLSASAGVAVSAKKRIAVPVLPVGC